MNTIDSVSEFQSQADQEGLRVNSDYLLFLKSKESDMQFVNGTDKRRWRLFTADELVETIPFSMRTYRRWRIPHAFANMIRKLGSLKKWGTGLELDSLDRAVAVAEDNGDFLFLTVDGSVWEFIHDGLEYTRLSESWNLLTREASCPSPALEKDLRLIGTWIPLGSTRVPKELYAVLAPTELSISEAWFEEHFADGSVWRFDWSTNGDSMRLWDGKDEIHCRYSLAAETLDWEVVDALRQFTYTRKPRGPARYKTTEQGFGRQITTSEQQDDG